MKAKSQNRENNMAM